MRHRLRGRVLKTWIKAMGEDILDLDIIDGLGEDRVAWRGIIQVVDLENIGNEL